jgi:hypothetical protein
MPTILSGQMDLGAATEGVALAANQDVASFTVNNITDSASAFTATIDWGDGATSPGTVVGSNGSFTVEGGHTYADESSPQATVTITRTADNTQTAPTGTISVGDADDPVTVQGVTTITGNPNQPLTNVTVATFHTNNAGNPPSDFAVSIDWGDGTTTPGTVSGSNGSFTVKGTHTYTANGDDTITVFVNDDAADAAFGSATSQALIGTGLGGHVVVNAATEGQALSTDNFGSPITIATFDDSNTGDTTGSFTATINWGDGSATSPGTILGSNGHFTVQGDHTYGDEGNFSASVLITRTSDSATTNPTGPVVVAEADGLTPTGQTIGATPNVAFSGTVATFTDNNNANTVADLTATIDWGDGTTTPGTVSTASGTFSVSGTHTYTMAGHDTVAVTLKDDTPGTATATANTDAFIGLAGQAVLTSATESVALSSNTAIATFSDGNLSDQASGFTATINWGDGTTTPGTVVGSNGSFTVEGGHAYIDEGSEPLNVTLVRTSDNASATASGNVAVAEADALTPYPLNFAAVQNQSFSGTVANFTDSDTLNMAGDFTAMINWGDGTTSVGTITGSNGSFTVSGTHTFAAVGQDTVKVTLTDDAPGTATATANGTATVTGTPLRFIGTGDFDANGRTDIAWASNGGGQATLWMNTNGTLTQSAVPGAAMGAGQWTAYGVGDFNGDGKSDILWTSNNGQVAVWEMNGPNLIGFGVPAGQMGASTWHVAAIGDFNGDGKSDLLWVTKNGGYEAVWTMNGTMLSNSAISNGAMGPEWSVLGTGDFNQDGRADVLWENTSGTVDIWEMNGANLSGFDPNVGTAPGRFAGVGHFTPVGQMGDKTSDIVWVDANNHVTIWEMSNGRIANTVSLNGADGLAWHLEGVGNFAGDANSDLLWINSNTGAVNIWEVNGSSVTEIPVNAPTGSPLTLQAGAQSQAAAQAAPQLLTMEGTPGGASLSGVSAQNVGSEAGSLTMTDPFKLPAAEWAAPDSAIHALAGR